MPKPGKHTQSTLRPAVVSLTCTLIGLLLAGATFAQGQTAKVVIQWWDQYLPLAPLHQEMWDAYMEEHPEVEIQYSQYNPADMEQAVPLAFRSGQAPDVLSDVFDVPQSQLVEQGWFVPIEPAITRETGILGDVLFEGLTVFDGQVYSFPTFNSRWYYTANWFNKDLIAEAGFDPEVGPQGWEEVREVARTVTEKSNGQVYGIILPLQFTSRMEEHVIDLAMTAGAPGVVDWRTGECAVDSKPFVQAINFLLSFEQDGSLHPASHSVDARQARARWAAGDAALFLDGPWNIGVLNANFPETMENVGVAPVPVPDPDIPSYTYSDPPTGTFWVSSQSSSPEVAADILKMFTSDEYYIGLAERMDQPPLDLSAVEKADVHPSYRSVLGYYDAMTRLAPEPVVKNPNAAQVYAEMRDIQPGLGEIIQGVFSGGVRDIEATLADYCNKWTAERQRAIGVVHGQGVEVSVDDWVFPNWRAGEDYAPEDYQ